MGHVQGAWTTRPVGFQSVPKGHHRLLPPLRSRTGTDRGGIVQQLWLSSPSFPLLTGSRIPSHTVVPIE